MFQAPLVSGHRQSSARDPARMERSLEIQAPLHPTGGHGPASADPPVHRYTTLLREHIDANGASTITYEKRELNTEVATWHCTATYLNFVGEGIGRTYREAKHLASKQICGMMGLEVR